MKIPCSVVRDLLPLYAEEMIEEETRTLVDEHLEECSECRINNFPPLYTTKPFKSKTLKLSPLAVRLLGCTYFFLIPWQDGLIEVVGVKAFHPNAGADEGDAAKRADEGLVLKVNSIVNGFEEHIVLDDDGTQTLLIQALSTNQASDRLAQSYYESNIFPVPDRLIYGLEQPQTLLWGTPMKGGVEILPRLALAYYLLMALAAAGVCGLIWMLLRKRKSSWIPRQLFFAPVAYIASHLLLKGFKTTSFSMEQDFLSILLVALAVYALLTIASSARQVLSATRLQARSDDRLPSCKGCRWPWRKPLSRASGLSGRHRSPSG